MKIQRFPASIQHLYEILDFVEEHAITHGFSVQESERITLAAEEVVMNVIGHNSYDIEELEIICEESRERPGIIIVIIDRGIPFNPVEALYKEATRSYSFQHGYGIPIIMGIMDKVEYRREATKNVLMLIRYL